MKMADSCPKGQKNSVKKGEIAHHDSVFKRLVQLTGEIAHYKQFFLFPLFSKDLFCRHVKTRNFFGKELKF